MNNQNKPMLYTEQQLDKIETHIAEYFGECAYVYHEVVSPDIHVDVCLIEPTDAGDCYTLVTMGAGAYKMNLPQKYNHLARAEYLICLPKDWKLRKQCRTSVSLSENWHWPLERLIRIARFPLENNAWLGCGHTISDGEPFADNTDLCCMLVGCPYMFNKKAFKADIGNGEIVVFYQLIPIYEEEMKFKKQHGAQALTDLFDEDFSDIVDIKRKNYCK